MTSFTVRFQLFAQGMLAGMAQHSAWLDGAAEDVDVCGIRSIIRAEEWLNRPDWQDIASAYVGILRARSERKARRQSSSFAELAQEAARMLGK